MRSRQFLIFTAVLAAAIAALVLVLVGANWTSDTREFDAEAMDGVSEYKPEREVIVSRIPAVENPTPVIAPVSPPKELVEAPAPAYPFDADAPLPLPRLNISALTNPGILKVFLRNNYQANPAGLPFTEAECQKLLDGARPEIELAHGAQMAYGEEIEKAVQRGRERYTGPKFSTFQEAAEYSRSLHRGTRLAKIVIAEFDGVQASAPIIVDPQMELETYLRYKAMLDISDVAAARIRQLIEAGAYR